jgi:hypothetical protein
MESSNTGDSSVTDKKTNQQTNCQASAEGQILLDPVTKSTSPVGTTTVASGATTGFRGNLEISGNANLPSSTNRNTNCTVENTKFLPGVVASTRSKKHSLKTDKSTVTVHSSNCGTEGEKEKPKGPASASHHSRQKQAKSQHLPLTKRKKKDSEKRLKKIPCNKNRSKNLVEGTKSMDDDNVDFYGASAINKNNNEMYFDSHYEYEAASAAAAGAAATTANRGGQHHGDRGDGSSAANSSAAWLQPSPSTFSSTAEATAAVLQESTAKNFFEKHAFSYSKDDDDVDQGSDANDDNAHSTDRDSEHGDDSVRWTQETHRCLVDAIYEVGISHASPSVIMEHMTFPTITTTEGENGAERRFDSRTVTSERLKSHLQKYRKNRDKSKVEFQAEYDQWVEQALSIVGGISAAARTSLATTPAAVIEMMLLQDEASKSPTSRRLSATSTTATTRARKSESRQLLGGELPAYLTFCVMLEEERKAALRRGGDIAGASLGAVADLMQMQRQFPPGMEVATDRVPKTMLEAWTISSQQLTGSLPSAKEYSDHLSGAQIQLPVMTDEECQSPLGVSMSHVAGLLHSLSHHVMKERTVLRMPHVAATRPTTAKSAAPYSVGSSEERQPASAGVSQHSARAALSRTWHTPPSGTDNPPVGPGPTSRLHHVSYPSLPP